MRTLLCTLAVLLAATPALAAKPKPQPRPIPTVAPAGPRPLSHDHDPDYFEDNSKDPELLLRVYARNSHLQRLLDLGLYQRVFDDDPPGEEAFIAAGAHVEGVPDLPLTPMAFAVWRHEDRTVRTLQKHGAAAVEETNDPDQLVRLTVDTVMGVTERVAKEMKAAEAEYKRTHPVLKRR